MKPNHACPVTACMPCDKPMLLRFQLAAVDLCAPGGAGQEGQNLPFPNSGRSEAAICSCMVMCMGPPCAWHCAWWAHTYGHQLQHERQLICTSSQHNAQHMARALNSFPPLLQLLHWRHVLLTPELCATLAPAATCAPAAAMLHVRELCNLRMGACRAAPFAPMAHNR